MQKSDFYSASDSYSHTVHSGTVSWQSPSNLAIVKYWGKYGEQLPRNPSLSITLSEAVTTTTIDYNYSKNRKKLDIDFLFEDKPNVAFKSRVEKFISGLEKYFPFLRHSKLDIKSSNSFPHSSGIASSASSMSVLALCLCDIERELAETNLLTPNQFLKKASFISRLGSGSACRSVYPNFAEWGKTSFIADSSDLYAVPFSDYHPVFDSLRNDILIVSKTEKSVSSSAGHQLMEDNPYAAQRFDQATQRINELKTHLNSGDVKGFGKLLESEALTLHALMMASDPSYMLIEPNTINVINSIRAFRAETNIPVYFSLDAGPNVHIISFEKDRAQVAELLLQLKQYAVGGTLLEDRIGEGSRKI